MFDTEGQENCVSYDAPREDAIASYDQLRGYTEGIKQYGIWAIEVKLIKTFTNKEKEDLGLLNYQNEGTSLSQLKKISV